MVAMRVVELRAAQPHLHIGHAHMVGRAIDQRAKLRPDRHAARVAHRVAQKVGRQLLVGIGVARAGCLPSEVNARCNSVVMASSRTGVGGLCVEPAGNGRTEAAIAA